MSRWVELSFIEDCKVLHKYGLNEYYNKANRGLYEFLNPELSYKYELYNAVDGQKMWKIEQQDGDPLMVVTLKKSNSTPKYWILDFYFPKTEKGYSKNKETLKGNHYLDTVSKIVKDEILPYFNQSDLDILYFKTYTDDDAGIMRKNLFKRMIDKFMDKDVFNVEIRNEDFIITKK